MIRAIASCIGVRNDTDEIGAGLHATISKGIQSDAEIVRKGAVLHPSRSVADILQCESNSVTPAQARRVTDSELESSREPAGHRLAGIIPHGSVLGGSGRSEANKVAVLC